jgi:hypothetical protein
MKIGSCNGCKLKSSELDVGVTWFFGDIGDVAKVAEKIVDLSDFDIFPELEFKNRGRKLLRLLDPQRRVDALDRSLRRMVGAEIRLDFLRVGRVSL